MIKIKILLYIVVLLVATPTYSRESSLIKKVLSIPKAIENTQSVYSEKNKRYNLFLSINGDDKNDGSSLQAPIKSIARLLKLIQSSSQNSSFSISFGAGVFEYNGEFLINRSAIIQGEGRGKTSIKLNLKTWDSGIRISTDDVTISDLTIIPNATERIATIPETQGGRAEYGTGITIGHYLENEPIRSSTNITLERLDIRRLEGSRINPGISILGRSQNIKINDIVLDFHSTGIIMHWGGYNNIGRSPLALINPDYNLYRTFHPSNISINNIVMQGTVRRAFIVSSSYNVTIKNVKARTASFLTMLPGDEIDLFAGSEDKGKINQNIIFENINIDLYNHLQTSFAEISSQGTSIIFKDENGERLKRIAPSKNLLFKNIKVSNYTKINSSANSPKNPFNTGLDLFRLEGENIEFRDIDLSKIVLESIPLNNGSLRSPKAVSINRSRNLKMINIKTRIDTKPFIKDSNDIFIENFGP